MRPACLSRSALLVAVASSALAGAASAQTAPPTQQADAVADVIVTGRPFGVTDNASLIAVDVLDEQALAGCRIGRDYPSPIVDHRQARDEYLALGKQLVTR